MLYSSKSSSSSFLYNAVFDMIFDDDWYIEQVFKVKGVGIDRSTTQCHYRLNWRYLSIDPSPLFNTEWYLSQTDNDIDDCDSPLDHYIKVGSERNLSPHPVFDPIYYRDNYGSNLQFSINPLYDFIRTDPAHHHSPSPLFDSQWYSSQISDDEVNGNYLKHYIIHGSSIPYSPHPLFDANWYLSQNADLEVSRPNPLIHYICHGAAEGRSPHPVIDGRAFARHFQAPKAEKQNVLAAYLDGGWRWNPAPSLLFDQEFYLASNPDVLNADVCPLLHFVCWGGAEGRNPHPLVDCARYLRENLDILEAGQNPLTHFIAHGAAEGRDLHALFDTAFYVANSPDINFGVENPMIHYLEHGWKEGRDPHPLFNTRFYLEQCPEIIDSNICPLIHFIERGARQGKRPTPLFDPHWYEAVMPEIEGERVNPLQHYIDTGYATGRDPGPNFNSAWYIATNPAVAASNVTPLTHYLTIGASEGALPLPPEQPVSTGVLKHNQIAVVYLARSENGRLDEMLPFVKSYRQYAAGIPHDLIILCKGGTRNKASRFALEQMLAGLDAQFIDFSDKAYDIQAYLKTAHLLEHEYFFFLNTHSDIRTDNWLQKLYTVACGEDVGVVGTSGSYESITESTDLNCKLFWLIGNEKLPYDSQLGKYFDDVVPLHAPDWIRNGPSGKLDPSAFDVEMRYRRYWCDVTRKGGPLYELAQLPRFPNPHLRTNAFMIRRDVFLSLDFDITDSKMACWLFESGFDGLPARIKRKRLRQVLVGADGKCFEEDQWVQSKTFRLGDQSNTMVYDNRFVEFDAMSPGAKKRMQIVSWGEYLARTPAKIAGLGYPFAKANPQRSPENKMSYSLPGQRRFTISVVIPTRNRIDLVKQAIYTIQQQNYPYWTCLIFDNASEDDIAGYVTELNDPRIKTVRSDTFLSVTESWNNAIDGADGDYVLLLGDDDGVTPGGFLRLKSIAEQFNRPDLIYSSFYHFVHPAVAPWDATGYLQTVLNGLFFDNNSIDNFLLDRNVAQVSVETSLRLIRSFAFNMQSQFFEKSFLKKISLERRVFHSPFPDYYIANVAFSLADSIVVVPKPVCIQGVSRKSFGFTLLNDEPQRGAALLNNDMNTDRLFEKFRDHILPGSPYNTNYTLTMLHVADRLGKAVPGAVSIDRYRRLQILNSLGGEDGLRKGNGPTQFYLDSVKPLLSDPEVKFAEELILLGAKAALENADEADTVRAAAVKLNSIVSAAQMYADQRIVHHSVQLSTGNYISLPEVFEALKTGNS